MAKPVLAVWTRFLPHSNSAHFPVPETVSKRQCQFKIFGLLGGLIAAAAAAAASKSHTKHRLLSQVTSCPSWRRSLRSRRVQSTRPPSCRTSWRSRAAAACASCRRSRCQVWGTGAGCHGDMTGSRRIDPEPAVCKGSPSPTAHVGA